MSSDLHEFITYLESNDLVKHVGSMVAPGKSGAKDVLGYYAQFADIPCRSGDITFLSETDKKRGPKLPDDHWLLATNTRGYTLARVLADINDTTEGFKYVIEFLRTITYT